jgi:hypothetical protein
MTTPPTIDDLTSAAAALTAKGLQIVPLGEPDPAKPDAPKACKLKGWPDKTFTAAQIKGQLERIAAAGHGFGIGVKMGQASGIVDIETDSAEQDAAVRELFGGDVPDCPRFNSKRGTHYLFHFPAAASECVAGSVRFNGVEIKLGAGGVGSQSAFPPSSNRQWVAEKSLDDLSPPELPAAVVATIVSLAQAKDGAGDPGEWSDKEFPAGSLDAFRSAAAPIPDAVQGENGSATLMRVAALVRSMVGHYEQALALLLEWNQAHCVPPFSDDEVERKLNESRVPIRSHPDDDFDVIPGPPIFSIGELIESHSALREPLIDGLARLGETVNIIADPKIGKSWFAYLVLLSITLGRPLFGRFTTRPGRVLLVDNELHRSTLARRIPTVAKALGVELDKYRDRFDVMPLRGKLRTIENLASDLAAVRPGTYSAIILDAKYRFALGSADENDNAWQAAFYNRIDNIAEQTGAAIFLISHASKGDQSGKRVTDVGAGGGAQSRAADCHLVIRPHEDKDVFVLDAVVRSFPPVEPLAIRWEYPLWLPAKDADPARLKRPASPRLATQASEDADGRRNILTTLATGRASVREICRRLGMGHPRANKLLYQLELAGQVAKQETNIRGNDCDVFTLSA